MQAAPKNKKAKADALAFSFIGEILYIGAFLLQKRVNAVCRMKKENGNEIILQLECRGHTAAAVHFREVLPCGQSVLLS